MQQIFHDLRVVEFGTGMASELAGLQFADNGAEVVKIEPPAGDACRTNPAFPMWNRGKKSVVLDLEDARDRSVAADLASTADIVISNFAPGEADRLGLSHAALASRNPALISLSITGFGTIDRFEYLGNRESIVSAKAGRFSSNGPLAGAHYSGRPVYIAAPIGSCGAAFLGVQGLCAALIMRLRTGLGQEVQTSLLDGLCAATMRLAFERNGDKVVPVDRRSGGATLLIKCIRLTFLTPECADGRHIQMCARQAKHFQNWLDALELGHLRDDPRFAGAPFGLKTMEDAEALEQMLLEGMKKRPMKEWIELFTTKYDVGADPFLLPDEFLQHPQMVLNDRIVDLEDAERGTVRQVGQLVKFEKTPSLIERSAPTLGEHQNTVPELLKRPAATPSQTISGKALPHIGENGGLQLPLSGVTILELAYYLAAPLATTILAEMGARIIKIEPIEGDPFRGAGLEFAHIVAGKESIGVNLKTAQGREIYRRLVSRCDAVLHNFRPGAPDRLGVDYETTKAINPEIVYLYGASYGSEGPERHRPAFHSTPNALNGGGILQAGRDNPPIDDSYPDPISGLAAGVALAMGLYAKLATGVGQYMETTMLASNGYVHSEILTRFASAPAMPQIDQGQHGPHALHRLYQCADGQYLFLSATSPHHWQGVIRALDLPELLGDRRFRDMRLRQSNDAELVHALQQALETRRAEEWERLFWREGVPAAAVFDSFERFLAEEGFLDQGEHATFGSYWKMKPRIRFSGGRTMVGSPAALGEHSWQLLCEIGFDSDSIGSLVETGVVTALPVADAAEHAKATMESFQ